MKFTLILATTIAFLSFIAAPTEITNEERKSAVKFLSDSEKNAESTVKKLSEAQLKFKPAADKWSVEECMMHIAATEKALWGLLDGAMKAPANPEKRSEIKWTDEEVMKNITDRTNKVKTSTALEPQNTGFKSVGEAVSSFNENRDRLIGYVNITKDDLRNHVTQMGPGAFDCYQMLLFIGAHSNRHVEQMKEVMADPNFPKK
jgi:hypothetical protein